MSNTLMRRAVVKKDFQNGKAVRKTTTMQNKNGGKSNLVVDKAKGIATRTKFGADGKKISETVRDFNTGLTTTTNFGADGNKTTEEVSDKKGLREKTTFGSNGQKVSKYERLANGSKTTSYDANGNVQKTVDDFTQAGQKHHHEADFKNGTRNYTIHDSKGNLLQSQNETRMNDGTVLRQSVDKVKGTESSYVIDRQEGDTLGLHDRVLARTETDSHTGNTTTIRYNPSPDVERTEEVKGRDGSGTTTTYRTNGQTEAVLTDAHGQETARSLTRQDGSKETTRYNRSSDGQVSGFTTIDKDASGKITRHFTVDTQNDTYTDKLTGETAKWSEYRQRS